VPVPTGSRHRPDVRGSKKTSVEEINGAIKAAAEGPMKGIIEYVTDPIVSSDIVGNPHSSIFDSHQHMVLDGDMVKVTMWYDNEWGYSCRSVDLIERIAKL
jgi:glyceraldehyde 3-phosphate dehydrogenase